ncbi:MAG: VTC domain-containing protein [Blastocatellia bacterium]
MLRYEYKYFVPYDRLERLRSLMQPFTELDKFAGQFGEYTVRSIYFDTSDWECYFQKVSGLKRRNKVRLRGYNFGDGGSQVFFEVKKKVDDPLHKHRAALSYEQAQQLLNGSQLDEVVFSANKNADARQEAQRFFYHLHARQMRPVVTVIYEREAFQPLFADRENDLRITFDKNLRAVAWPALDELFVEQRACPVKNNHFILEIKFNRYLPGWLRTVTQSLELTRSSASKYALCLEAHPEIAIGSSW